MLISNSNAIALNPSPSTQVQNSPDTPPPVQRPPRPRSGPKYVPPPPREYTDDVVEQADALLQGTPTSSVDPVLFPDIVSYLREQQSASLKKAPPDYPTAQRADDVCSALLLLIDQSAYCGHKSSAMQALQIKIDQGKDELQKVLDERDRCFTIFDKRRQRALNKLRHQQQRELQEHDNYFAGEMPHPRTSSEVLQIREQERHLQQSRRYIEAKQMHEEADALEAFEIEKQKIQWHNEGVSIREAILHRHEQYIQCVLEKYEQRWQAMIPDSIAREKHWRAVIATLERKVAEERSASAEVERTARGLLCNQTEGLPALGKGTIPTPMRRAMFANSKRAYSVGRVRRR